MIGTRWMVLKTPCSPNTFQKGLLLRPIMILGLPIGILNLSQVLNHFTSANRHKTPQTWDTNPADASEASRK